MLVNWLLLEIELVGVVLVEVAALGELPGSGLGVDWDQGVCVCDHQLSGYEEVPVVVLNITLFSYFDEIVSV